MNYEKEELRRTPRVSLSTCRGEAGVSGDESLHKEYLSEGQGEEFIFGDVECQCPLEFYKQSAGLELEMEEAVWTRSLQPFSWMRRSRK